MIERNLETIGCLIPEINWLQIFSNVLSSHNDKQQTNRIMNESEFIQTRASYDVHYLINLSRLLSQTDRRTIANYLGWRVVESYGFLIGGNPFIGIDVFY